MKKLAAFLLTILTCLPARADTPTAAVVAPVSIVGVVLCGHYIGSLFVMPDGTVIKKASAELSFELAKAIADTLPQEHVSMLNIRGAVCGTDT